MATTCSPYAGDMPARDKIVDIYTDGYLQATERQLRFATAGLGLRLSPGAKILDFGCGIGSSVRALLAQGYDAYGVDVLEYWDRDFDKYWLIGDKPSAEVADRLKLADPANYRLPFKDGTFDFCFSDQVFEHIFDYKTTMSEIVRVLKPSGLSLHNFPGPNNFMERLTPERVAAHVENRRQAVRHWAQANPSFVARFEDARQRWLEQNRR